MGSVRRGLRGWKADPESFWTRAAQAIDWIEAPAKALDASRAPLGWFPDAVCNACWNAVDRHVEAGHGERVAIIHDSPMTGSTTSISYAELRDRVARLAGALAARGVGKGDRVVVYMPMVPEALVAMLACARLGDPFSGLRRLRGARARGQDRRRDAEGDHRRVLRPRAGRVVAYKPLVDAAIEMAAHKPAFVVVLQREQAPAKLGPRGRRVARRAGGGGARARTRSSGPTRSTSSTPRGRPARRRAWCAPPPATSSRSPGRCRTSTASRPAMSSGRPPTSAGSSGTPSIG